MSPEVIVHVVDDDPQARRSVCALVRSMGLRAEGYESAEEFLAQYTPGSPGCLVTDVRLLGMSGLELQDELRQREIRLPVIVLTGYARTPLTVRALKAGAVTLLEKPYNTDELWDAIRGALWQDAAARTRAERHEELRRRLASLSASEQAVLELLVAGHTNKAIAQQLGVSLRTVENRRHDILAKMQAASVVDLVRLVIDSGGNGGESSPPGAGSRNAFR